MEIQQESVFVSAVRSFCKVFFAVIGVLLALFTASFVYSMFSSPFAPVEKTTMNLLPDLNDEVVLHAFNSPVILRINIDGVIGEPQKLDTEIVQNILMDSRNGFLAKDRVKGILLYLNTPGGTVTDSDNIYRMLMDYRTKYNIPIYAYVDGMCCSGGMYVSSAAQKMYASPPSIVGSVGVIIGPFFNVVDGLNKIGVKADTITRGLDKDMMNPFRVWAPDEDSYFSPIIEHFYKQFCHIVTSAPMECRKKLNPDDLVKTYGAKIYTGPDAVDIGYIDVADASYKTALADLMAQAKIDPKQSYQVVELVPRQGWLGPITGKNILSGKVEHTVNFDKYSAIRDQFSYLYDPTRQ